MSDKQLLFDALRGKTTPRPAWVPFVGVHGGQLIGVTATEYLTSADRLVEGLSAAVERYRPDGLPVVFDVQIEAEVLGCELNWNNEGPPSVMTHPLEMGLSLADLPEYSTTAGRFPVIGEAIDRLHRQHGDNVAFYGLITGPFTLALHLLGNLIFLDMYDHPEKVGALLAYCRDVAIKTADFYLDRGIEVIAVVDPMTSQISPEHFVQFETLYVDAIFDHIRQRGAFSSLFVCGDATRNLDVMCQTHCDNICVDENIDLGNLARIARAAGKSVGGNLQLTTVLLLGNAADAARDAVRCLDAGGDTGFVLAPGCDLPWGVPPENLEAVARIVHDPYQREIARQTVAARATDDFADIAVPDYAAEPDVYLDIITLDSATCPPCQYMVAAAEQVARKSPRVVVREHKIKNRDGLGYMTKLKATAIPTICIDGKPAFSSIIPNQTALAQAVQQAADRKK
ncbi:MAG: uroporphyrinogen decarboxylase family protein [Lentisphaeria bacterium]|jgi:uroporphyrinogen decarboxylase|nr:uroporphyrinogen decarboxylase family protein [Lentisphaeria bacterium]